MRKYRRLTGARPGEVVDHINGDTKDNRPENLRVVTHSLNHANGPAHKDSKTGVRGVWWVPPNAHCLQGKYVAQVRVNGTRVTLGSFKTLEEAAVAVERVYPRDLFPYRYAKEGT